MSATVSTDFLLLCAQATPEQQANIERYLRSGKGEALGGEGGGGNGARFLFRKAGSRWRVVFDGKPEFHLEDKLGVRYLDYLLHHANETLSAFDLEVAVRPERESARSKDSIQRVADPEAMRGYLRELARLREEREEAAEEGNLAGADRLDGEIDALESAIRGGARSGDAGERARSNVSKAVAAVRRRLATGDRAEREFGEHIERFVSMGYRCMYAQPGEICWE